MTTSDARPAPGFDRRPGFPMSFLPAEGRIRVVFAGTTIVDAAHAMIMLEDGHAPVYYFARDEVRMDLLSRTTRSSR
jgi:uncharacterized protein (DUF427 family)